MRSTLLLLTVVALAACGARSDDGGGPDGGARNDAGILLSCETGGSSDLAGVRIEFPTQECELTLAEAAVGVTFTYQVVVENELEGIIPVPQDGGRCGVPGPSGFIPFEQVVGGEERWCVCDVGLCANPEEAPRTIARGTTAKNFFWDGQNWEGPSDTGNEPGPPFPAGEYEVRVTLIGDRMEGGSRVPFVVTGSMGVTLRP